MEPQGTPLGSLCVLDETMPGASMDETLTEVVTAAINHFHENFNGDPSPVDTLLAAIEKSSEDASAIEAIVEGIVSASKPRPVESLVDHVLEEAILRARLEMKRYSTCGTALKAFTNAIQVCDVGFTTKYALFKHATLARDTEPAESVVEQSLRESLMAVIERIKLNSSLGQPFSVAGLVDLLLKSWDEPVMRQALVDRLIHASRVTLSHSAIDSVFTKSFMIAIQQVRDVTLLEFPEEALMAAVDRLADEPFSKEVFKKAIASSSKALEAAKYLEKEAFREAAMAAIEHVMLGNFLECPLGHFVHAMSSLPVVNLIEEHLINQLILCSKPAPAALSAMMHAGIRLLICHSKLPLAKICSPPEEEEEDVQQFLDFLSSSVFHSGVPTPVVFFTSQNISKEIQLMEELGDAVFIDAINIAVKRLQASSSSLSPEEALVVSVERLSKVSYLKWELLKQIILAGKSSPPDGLVDQALQEAILSAINKTRRAMSGKDSTNYSFDLLEGRTKISFHTDFIRFLVEGIDESVADLSMKHAIIKRVLFASKPIQPEYSGKQILTAAFQAAICQLQGEPLPESPAAALAAAIERSTFRPLVKHVLTELVMSTALVKRSKSHMARSADVHEDGGLRPVRSGGMRLSASLVGRHPPSKFKVKQKFKVQK